VKVVTGSAFKNEPVCTYNTITKFACSMKKCRYAVPVHTITKKHW